jgi:hypothetical protein
MKVTASAKKPKSFWLPLLLVVVALGLVLSFMRRAPAPPTADSHYYTGAFRGKSGVWSLPDGTVVPPPPGTKAPPMPSSGQSGKLSL